MICGADLAPVHFLSHGTAALLQEDSRVRDYWRKLGKDALSHGIKGIIVMVMELPHLHRTVI